MTATRSAWLQMPALALVLSASFVLGGVLGCSLLKRSASDDEDPPVGNAPTVTVTGTGAKNERDVLRYGNETKLADEPGVIGKDGTKARQFPATGGPVATLAKGTRVVKNAKFFSTGVLITFDDPATADGTKLMGWVSPDSLAPSSGGSGGVAPLTTPVSPAFVAPKAAGDAGGVKPVVVVDAGGAGVVDAGGGGAKPAVVVDAGGGGGGGNGGGSTTLLQVNPIDGKCPAGFILAGPACRRPCGSDGDCPKGTFCVSTGGRRTCSATK